MKLVDLTWSTYRVPFRGAFLTAHGALSTRSGAFIVACISDGYTGYGEIAPLPEHSGQSLNMALNALPVLARELPGREVSAILRFLETQSEEEQLPSSLICGLETALLDAVGQARDLRVADLLTDEQAPAKNSSPGALRAHIPVNAVISGPTTGAAVASARAAIQAGFSCLKLKLAGTSQAMLERVAAVRAAIGPEPRLRLDANESWNFEQARALLAQYAVYDIEYIEQPLPARDLDGMARLRHETPIPLAADEALSGLESARRILNTRSADVLILKPQLAGGLRACHQIIHEASKQQVVCVITSTLETGIGIAAALHLAASAPEITLPCGLATLALLEDDLLREELPIQQGHLELPRNPGLGVHPDRDALERFAVIQ